MEQLSIYCLYDSSGSMLRNGAIFALNNAARELIPPITEFQEKNREINITIQVLTFSDGAGWHVQNPTPVDQLFWKDIIAENGLTDLGCGFELLSAELKYSSLEGHRFPPIIVLASDGQPTDQWEKGLMKLNSIPQGRRAVRIAIAIGEDVGLDVLEQFLGQGQPHLFLAKNADALAVTLRESFLAGLKWAAA